MEHYYNMWIKRNIYKHHAVSCCVHSWVLYWNLSFCTDVTPGPVRLVKKFQTQAYADLWNIMKFRERERERERERREKAPLRLHQLHWDSINFLNTSPICSYPWNSLLSFASISEVVMSFMCLETYENNLRDIPIRSLRNKKFVRSRLWIPQNPQEIRDSDRI